MENRLQRLVPRAAVAEAIGTMEALLGVAVPSRVIEARSDSTSTTSSTASCTSNSSGDTCQKPIDQSTFTLPIVLGVCLPIAGALTLFYILHRRHLKKQKLEDMDQRHASLDFGLGDVQIARSRKDMAGVSSKEMIVNEKSLRSKGKSMDMSLDSPYLLPPEVHNSRESLHSLSRSDNEDPYRPVASYYPNDDSSRSASRLGRDNASIYSASSRAPSRLQDLSAIDTVGPLSHNNPSVVMSNPRAASLQHATTPSSPIVESPLEEFLATTEPTQPAEVYLAKSPNSPPMEAKPLPASLGISRTLAAPAPAASSDRDSYNIDNIRRSNNYLAGLIETREPSPSPIVESVPPPQSRRSPPPAINTSAATIRPARKESLPAEAPPVNIFDDQVNLGDAFKVTPPSPGQQTEVREQRYSMDVPPEEFVSSGLGAPGFDARRLSMGFRPLPPDALTEVDDPELRANRIRSFYKEYFDESKPLPQGQYYEDFDQNYLGEAAYFDSQQNNFVMPYAQPVTRRAMTPPPRGPRFQGPPRSNHSSMGGPRGPQMYPSGPRAFSSASNRPAFQKPLPPPAALTSLPTPSKLKDDTFAIMGAIDFAPPLAYRDRAAGRSESPLGERRPYSPMVPAFTPTRSTFDDLAAMPSPHHLRKSGTFTGLDFAPPKRFKDFDTGSDAGSIRSTRSGVSAAHHAAIRNGAYRVSRIPQDVVFTRDDLATTLKPSWGMRPHDV